MENKESQYISSEIGLLLQNTVVNFQLWSEKQFYLYLLLRCMNSCIAVKWWEIGMVQIKLTHVQILMTK